MVAAGPTPGQAGPAPPSWGSEGTQHLSGALVFPPPEQGWPHNAQLQDPAGVAGFVLTAAVALIFVNVNYNFCCAQTCSTHKTCLHTRGDNWWGSLLAAAGPGRLLGGSIFLAGQPDCPLTHICFYK